MPKGLKYIFIFAVILCLTAVLSYRHGIGSSVNNTGDDAIFTVNQGESVDRIGQNLTDAGLIGSKLYFKIYVRQTGLQSGFQAGEYSLNPRMSIKDITEVLTSGRSLSRERDIKIIEGWDIDDIDGYLRKNDVVGDDEFSLLTKSEIGNWKLEISKPNFLQDAPPAAGLEGYLFPDTYRIYRDATTEEIIAKMLDNFGSKLTPPMRDDIASQHQTIYEIVTMASIIEKEVRTGKDMKIVAGIFWDRIKNGQPLESCATLAYILGVDKQQYTLEDTKIDSPYNTYQNRGLPPGPICSPGLKSIQAAIYPEYTEFNYFLSRPDTGETVFSKTYDEHLRNKAKYLK